MRLIDLTDNRFGRLVVQGRSLKKRGKEVKWECFCDCGENIVVAGAELRRGETKSCGCIRRERNNGYRHGMGKTRPYRIWINMKERCLNPNNPAYVYYGGRGITICEEWINSFESFWNDMKYSYADNLTLDRKNNNLGYSVENCRWRDWAVQANNRRFLRKKKNKLPECVRRAESGKYELRLTLDRKHRTIGSYTSLEEAVQVRDELRSKRKIEAERRCRV